MYVMGIDPKTTRIATCTMESWNSNPVQSIYEIQAVTIADKCNLARKYVRRVVYEFAQLGDVVVFVEAPIVGRNVLSSLQVAKVQGACLTGAVSVSRAPGCHLVKVYEVGVPEWKKKTQGNGRAHKPDVAAWLYKFWRQAYQGCVPLGSTVADEDAVDAAAICWYGMKTTYSAAPRMPGVVLRKARHGAAPSAN